MPLHLFIPGPQELIEHVSTNNLEAIDSYIQGANNTNTLDRFDRIWHVALRAIDNQNTVVLDHISDILDFDHTDRSGNTFKLFELAVENGSDTMIEYLWEVATDIHRISTVKNYILNALKRFGYIRDESLKYTLLECLLYDKFTPDELYLYFERNGDEVITDWLMDNSIITDPGIWSRYKRSSTL